MGPGLLGSGPQKGYGVEKRHEAYGEGAHPAGLEGARWREDSASPKRRSRNGQGEESRLGDVPSVIEPVPGPLQGALLPG